jgi:hypothetical protein
MKLCWIAHERLRKPRSTSIECAPDVMRWSHNYYRKYQPLSAYKMQVRRMRTIELARRILRRFSDSGDIKPMIELKPLKDDDEKFATIVEDRTRELAALDRYERRAISKRKSAIRRFDSAYRFAEQ